MIGDATGYYVQWDQKSRTVLLFSQTTNENARGFMWGVGDSGNTVYLVGLIHLADDSFYPLRSEFEEVFAEADYLGVEIEISKASDEEQQQLIMKMGMFNNFSPGTTGEEAECCNIGMANKIESYLNSDEKAEYFIVVGAGHYLD